MLNQSALQRTSPATMIHVSRDPEAAAQKLRAEQAQREWAEAEKERAAAEAASAGSHLDAPLRQREITVLRGASAHHAIAACPSRLSSTRGVRSLRIGESTGLWKS